MARENLDITTVVFNNGSYAILNIELARVGVANPGPKALSMLSLRDPDIQWAKLSESMGVPARRATTAAEFREALEWALSHKGPRLVEAVI
jgi:acetolactate synthase-1/2/3 large subunit